MNPLEQWEFYFYWILLPLFILITLVAVTMIWPSWISKLLGFFDRGYDYENDEHEDFRNRGG